MKGLAKAIILLDRSRPKVPYSEVKRIVEASGVKIVKENAEFGIVVGGDGLFSFFGRSESIPLMFVGVKSSSLTESKAYLAATYMEELASSIKIVREGKYLISEVNRLEVKVNGKVLGSVFTDVYIQRGAESNCIRYMVEVKGSEVNIREYAIGDGFVVCTRAGSTGYFSYLDKLRSGENLEPDKFTLIGDKEIGLCHIVPTYTEREGDRTHPLRYTVPIDSLITIRLVREADARLYGVTNRRSGIRVSLNDRIEISKSKEVTRVIKLGPMRPPL
jgi:hypothetical protein